MKVWTKEEVGNIPGKPPLTDAERQRIADEWNVNEQAKPMNRWLQEMALSDHKLPRAVEDIIDVVGPDKIPEALRKKYDDKKALRAARPGAAGG